MMLAGIHKISRPHLAQLLHEAREALPTELGYVQGTVEEFIRRVEGRSSLLMMTGHDIEDGQLVEFFEFRHLTFQEFLTARAMVEGWHPGRTDGDSLTTVLAPHFTDEEWSEVIPLAAVLGGKATEELIKRLTSGSTASILGSCLADEAAARPETVRAALREVVRAWDESAYRDFAAVLVTGKYAGDLREEARKLFITPTPTFNAGLALAEAVGRQTINGDDSSAYSKAAWRFVNMLKASDRFTRCEGSLGSVYLLFLLANGDPAILAQCYEPLQVLGSAIERMLYDENEAEQYSACFALVWLGACRVWSPTAKSELLKRLLALWLDKPESKIGEEAGWAFVSQPIESRSNWPCDMPEYDRIKRFVEKYEQTRHPYLKIAVLVIAWYTHFPWTDEEIAKRANDLNKQYRRLEDRPEGRTLGELIRLVNQEFQGLL